jgi:hypothetical protein
VAGDTPGNYCSALLLNQKRSFETDCSLPEMPLRESRERPGCSKFIKGQGKTRRGAIPVGLDREPPHLGKVRDWPNAGSMPRRNG